MALGDARGPSVAWDEFSGADKVEAAEGMEWTEQESEWKPVSLLLLFSRDS